MINSLHKRLAIVLAAGIQLLAATQMLRAQCSCAGCGDGCTYPATAYASDGYLPMPAEPPFAYMGRALNNSRGPYGYAAVEMDSAATPGVDDSLPADPLRGTDATASDGFASYTTSNNTMDPSELSQSYTEDYDAVLEGEDCCGPTDRKEGCFQKLAFQGTFADRGDAESMGFADLETWIVFGLPCPTRENPMLITPGFGAHLLDGPIVPDVPAALYDVYLQLRWLGKVGDCWGYDVVFTPGVYSDFEEGVNGQAWRYTGRAVGMYEWSPWLQLIFGVAYLDREDVAALPVAGVIYKPCDDVRYEMIFPRPRYARRFCQSCDREDWWYIAGEFGGGSWSVERANGDNDVLTLNDWRILFGVESKLNGGASRKLEVGYVFARELEYKSSPTVYELDSAFLVRAGVTY